MKALCRLIKRLVLLGVVLVPGLVSPVAYVETMCRPEGTAVAHVPLVGPDWQRAEGRTLMTYPEWQIVHAYADCAVVIRTADPHAYGFLSSVADFWSSTFALSRASGPHGGFPWETKQRSTQSVSALPQSIWPRPAMRKPLVVCSSSSAPWGRARRLPARSATGIRTRCL